jgi:hypothetical protein
MPAQQDPQRRLVVGVVVQCLLRRLARGHPVARLQQGGRRHPAGAGGQALQRGQPQLRPLAGRRRGTGAAQQRQCHPGRRGRTRRVARPLPPVGLVGERSQFGSVQPVAAQQVTAVAVVDPVAAEDRAEPAHQHGKLVVGPGGRGVAPQRVGEHGRWHHLPVAERQQLQREPGLPAAQGLRLHTVHAEVAEHSQR